MKKIYLLLIAFGLLTQTGIGQTTILISQGGTVSVNDGDLFYDAGGAAGNDGNTNYTITLTPAVAGESICLEFSMFNTYFDGSWSELGDSVCIFDGINTAATKIATLVGNYGADWNSNDQVGWNASGNMPTVTTPTIFCSTTANGSLTVSFNNYNSTQKPGWAATIRTFKRLGNPGCNIDLTTSVTPICEGESVTLTVVGDIVNAQGKRMSK